MTHQNFNKLFTLYFIVFGIVISLSAVTINYYLQIKEIDNTLDKKAKEIFKMKNEDLLKNTITNMDNTLKSLANNKFLDDYISIQNNNKEKLKYLFLAIANSNNTIMQARFLDKNGHELIRVDRNSIDESPFIIEESKLQDKSQRDYFKILSNMNKNSIWHSRIDLNVENGQVEIPYKPTYRIGMPIFSNNKFEGIVIINILISDLLNMIANSATFDHYILDKNHDFILHPNKDFSFNKYKNIKKDVKEDFPKGLISDEIYIYSLKDIFKNEDDAFMVLKPKEDYKNEIMMDKINTLLLVFFFTILLSLVMSILLSKTPKELQAKLLKAHEKLNEFKTIIDKYVITAKTNPDSTILEVSDAFEKSSGYSKNELIGKAISIIKHPEQDINIINDLWSTILEKNIWSGIIRNKKKNGEEYWLEQTIIPKINKENNIESIISIGIDMTAKIELEKMASIDNLTKIYNRRMLDHFLKIEIDIANRHKDELSLMIIDIDNFKDVNDSYGHFIGDTLLTTISRIISQNLRVSDIFGRYGGEEFLIISTKTKKENAFILAEKLRIAIEKYKFEEVGGKTISIGISSLEKNDNVESLFKKADIALYEAKNSGKNKSIIFYT